MDTSRENVLPDASTSPSPATIVAAFIAAVERRDIEAALALLTDDCVYDNVPIGPVHGRAGVRGILDPIMQRCEEIEWPVIRTASDGRVVFNERLDRFRSGERWIELPVAGVWEVDDGKISLWRDFFDLATYRDQTG